MPTEKIQATARVRVLIEVQLPDRWGDACSVSQVLSQARQSAVRRFQKLMEHDRDCRVVGEPEVTAVLASERDK